MGIGDFLKRGVAEMTHDLCHRTESTMARIYGGWRVEELTNNWARFAANQVQSGTAAVGTCHYPPNAEDGYDYANPRTVQSTAADWLNFPKLTGKKSAVSCETWGGPDYHRNYMKWWFSHLPHAAGSRRHRPGALRGKRRGGLGGARQIREALPDRLQRRRPDHRGGRCDIPRPGSRHQGATATHDQRRRPFPPGRLRAGIRRGHRGLHGKQWMKSWSPS